MGRFDWIPADGIVLCVRLHLDRCILSPLLGKKPPKYSDFDHVMNFREPLYIYPKRAV